MEMTLAHAKRLAEACREKANEIGVPMVISVVDRGANDVLLERMDGAMIAAVSIARDKAYTAAATTFATKDLGGISQPGGVAYGVARADGGRIMIFAGGIPLQEEGATVGAIGVSGGLANQDQEVAEAGVKAFEAALAQERKSA